MHKTILIAFWFTWLFTIHWSFLGNQSMTFPGMTGPFATHEECENGIQLLKKTKPDVVINQDCTSDEPELPL